jgi:hypothetical protein
MKRRQFSSMSFLGLLSWAAVQKAQALSLSDLTGADASKGLKIALEKGAMAAVSTLGAQNGFMGNDKVRIALPSYLTDAAKLMRTFGQGGKVDELEMAMNRGAEMAVPHAKELLVKAVQTMSVQDAKGILSGGGTSVTEFFETKTRSPLATRFLPIVTQATAKVDLASKFNDVAQKAAELGLIKKDEANIQKYVTDKALNGLYYMIGQEEMKIRDNPADYGSKLLTKVFGALK